MGGNTIGTPDETCIFISINSTTNAFYSICRDFQSVRREKNIPIEDDSSKYLMKNTKERVYHIFLVTNTINAATTVKQENATRCHRDT